MLSPLILFQYDKSKINEKLEYWIDYWCFLARDYEYESVTVNIYLNPIILIEDILDEIKFNNLKNKENNKFFNDNIQFISKNDPVIIKYFKSEFSLLTKEFHNFNIDYIKNTCIFLLNKLINSNQCYVHNSILELEKYISDDDLLLDRCKNDIKFITNSFFSYLIKLGYDLNHIKKIPQTFFSFSSLSELKNHALHTNYLHPKNRSIKNNISIYSSNQEINDDLNNFSIKDRILKISDYYINNPKRIYKYIFYLSGIQLNEPVIGSGYMIYNPFNTKVINSQDNGKQKDIFHTQENYHSNILIEIEEFNSNLEAGYLKAINKIYSLFGILKTIFNVSYSFELKKDQCIILDENGTLIFGKYTKQDFNRLYQPIDNEDLDDKLTIRLNNLFSLFNDVKNEDSSIYLRNSIIFYQRAIDSNSIEESILNHWISIENIFSHHSLDYKKFNSKSNGKFDFIVHTIPIIMINKLITEIGWSTFLYFDNLVNFEKYNSSINLNISLETKIKSTLGQNDRNLISFLSTIDEISSCLSSKHLIELLENCKRFYFDVNYGNKKISDFIIDYQNTLLIWYRYRNKIVHNAHFFSDIVNSQTNKIKKINIFIINKIINSLLADSSIDVQYALYSIYFSGKLIKEKSYNDNIFNVLTKN